MKPKVIYNIPWSFEKNIGKAYNDSAQVKYINKNYRK